MLVVVIVAVATGIGFSSDGVIAGVIGGIIGALIGWALWAGITYIIGTTLFRTPQTKADWGELARTLGFAQSPGVLKVFGFIPILGPLLFLIVSIWQLVAMIIAIRQALDYTSTWRAIGVAVVGLVPYVIPHRHPSVDPLTSHYPCWNHRAKQGGAPAPLMWFDKQ